MFNSCNHEKIRVNIIRSYSRSNLFTIDIQPQTFFIQGCKEKKQKFSLMLKLATRCHTKYKTFFCVFFKVLKTKTGPSQGGRAWSTGPESELFEILLYMDLELTPNQDSRFGPSGLDWLCWLDGDSIVHIW